MFKELVVTGLLSFSVGSHSLQPRNANRLYSLYGCYCMNEEFDVDVTSLSNDAVVIDYNVYYDAFMLFHLENDNYIYNTTIRTFEFNYVDVDTFEVHLYDGEYSLRQEITTGDDIYDLYTEMQIMVLFFPTPYYVSEYTYQVFNCFYNNNGNPFVTKYSGWYSFNTSSISTYNGIFTFNGFITADNNLYNYIDYRNKTCTCYIRGVDYQYGVNGGSTVVVDNGVLKSNVPLLLSDVLIPDYIRTQMLLVGTFSYTYTPVEYTFGDMVFSVVDAPIYMLSQLFSFELFGLQFYVAFMGVVTILLICFIVRKVV